MKRRGRDRERNEMHEVVAAKYIEAYVLDIEFEDGTRKRIDFEEFLTGEVYEPLRDVRRFSEFQIDRQLGTLVWDTGADFCPDFLYSYAKEACESART